MSQNKDARKLELKELETMSKGLAIALKYIKDRRFTNLESAYGECLVAQKLVENNHVVEFKQPQFDLLVDGKIRVEVKCGELWDYGASASFGKGDQIREKKFNYCIFVIIDRVTFEPKNFFVFSINELEECTILRPKWTMPDTSSALFFYKDFMEFEKDSKEKGEPIFNIEKQLCDNPKLFDNQWNKIQ